MVASAKAGETLLVSFAGHGLIDEKGRFYMATSKTDPVNVAATSIAWDDVANALSKSAA